MPSLKLCSPVWARDRAGCGTTLRLVTGDIDVGHPRAGGRQGVGGCVGGRKIGKEVHTLTRTQDVGHPLRVVGKELAAVCAPCHQPSLSRSARSHALLAAPRPPVVERRVLQAASVGTIGVGKEARKHWGFVACV